MFSDFDFGLLDDPEFKEDSVREEIIAPLLRQLGYSAGGPAKITRSKALTHPYVYLGSQKYKINIIPDYVLAVEDHRWILDAKAPKEDLLKGKNPQQAFSYAIHPEIRATRYALCNGRQLAVFDISKVEPVLVVELKEIDEKFAEIVRLLSPIALTKPHLLNFNPDFGVYLLKLGCTPNTTQVFFPMGIGCIARVEDDLYTAFVNIDFDNTWLAVSFDFDKDRYGELLKVLPNEISAEVENALRRQPYRIFFKDTLPEVCISARLSEYITSNQDEDYCPFIVEKFF